MFFIYLQFVGFQFSYSSDMDSINEITIKLIYKSLLSLHKPNLFIVYKSKYYYQSKKYY